MSDLVDDALRKLGTTVVDEDSITNVVYDVELYFVVDEEEKVLMVENDPVSLYLFLTQKLPPEKAIEDLSVRVTVARTTSQSAKGWLAEMEELETVYDDPLSRRAVQEVSPQGVKEDTNDENE